VISTGSVDEGQALFYSLVESAKLAGLELAAYLADATRRAIENPRCHNSSLGLSSLRRPASP